MPTIPKYERQQSIPGVSGQTTRSVGEAGAEGRALAGFADQASDVIFAHAERLKRQDEANKELFIRSEYDSEVLAFKEAERQKKGSDSYGNKERAESFRDLALKKYTKDIDSERVKLEVKDYIYSRSASLMDSLSIHQATQRSEVTKQALDSNVEQIIKSSYSGESFEETNQRLIEAVYKLRETGLISEEDAILNIQNGQSAIAEARIDGLIQTNPELAIEEIKSGEYKQYLTRDKIEELDSKATRIMDAMERDKKAQQKEQERLNKLAIKEAQAETGNLFVGSYLDGSLTREDVQKSNLEPTGENSKMTWIKKIEAREKKVEKNKDEKWKTDPKIEADFNNRIFTLDKDNEKEVEQLKNDLLEAQGSGLSPEDSKRLFKELETRVTVKDKPAVATAKSQIKSMYNRGDFGKVVTGSEKYDSDSWKSYSNILIEYQQRIIDDPQADHSDWLNGRIEQEGVKNLYKKLDADWSFFGVGDESNKIISEWLKSKGKATTPKNIEAVKQMYQSREK